MMKIVTTQVQNTNDGNFIVKQSHFQLPKESQTNFLYNSHKRGATVNNDF